jgi:hypothetical protein
MKPNNCKGVQPPVYTGPRVVAIVEWIDMLPPGEGDIGPREKKRSDKVEGRLNNPRKTEQMVLQEIVAKVQAQRPETPVTVKKYWTKND